MSADKILVIGSEGQIGTVLSHALRDNYGTSNVITSDINEPKTSGKGSFEKLNILDGEGLLAIVKKHKITQIYHLAALLSAKGEQNPRQTWDVNMNGLFNVLEVGRQEKLDKIFFLVLSLFLGDKHLEKQHHNLPYCSLKRCMELQRK